MATLINFKTIFIKINYLFYKKLKNTGMSE